MFYDLDAGVSELADETDSKSVIREGVWVQVPPPAPGSTWKQFACEAKSKLFSFMLAFSTFRLILVIRTR